ncbi:hypothetical protein PG997_001625 [Apiospora hydei]|uniref:Uncharacterized protein n=1 Tax=Apiospora hydei TaxID=1337664 RepID=A0ABR1XE15_9PEZI
MANTAHTTSPGPPSDGESVRSTRPRLERANLFNDKDPTTDSVQFILHPWPERPRAEQPWLGELAVKAGNVPQLMEEGFAIAAENIIREQGFVERTGTFQGVTEQMRQRWPVTRHFVLRDRSQEPPSWTAHMRCLSTNFKTLSDIRPCDLTHGNVAKCIAWSIGKRMIYHFDRATTPRDDIDCVYDDLTLRGLWPWPKTLD